MGVERRFCKVLVGKPVGKRPLGRPRSSRWEDGIRMCLGEIGWGRNMDLVSSGYGL
jgi:hypothetical protein